MPEPFIGEVRAFPFNFAPAGWVPCDGRLLSVLTEANLFAVLGTTYGGDGVTTFAVPDLRGRALLGPGQGPGLPAYVRGETGGQESVALTEAQLPTHTHALRGGSANGESDSPANRVPARVPSAIPAYAATSDVALGPQAVGTTGGGLPHNNRQPYLALNFAIAKIGNPPS